MSIILKIPLGLFYHLLLTEKIYFLYFCENYLKCHIILN